MNPDSALDAILQAPKRYGTMTVYPLTIQRIAVLELLRSPLFRGQGEWKLYDILAAIWTMTSSLTELANVDSFSVANGTIERRIWQWAGHNTKALTRNSDDILIDIRRQTSQLVYMIPEWQTEENTKGHKTSNGWLAQTLYVSVAEIGLTDMTSVINTIPILQLMLMRRQKHYNDVEGNAMTLEDKEQMAKMDIPTDNGGKSDGE